MSFSHRGVAAKAALSTKPARDKATSVSPSVGRVRDSGTATSPRDCTVCDSTTSRLRHSRPCLHDASLTNECSESEDPATHTEEHAIDANERARLIAAHVQSIEVELDSLDLGPAAMELQNRVRRVARLVESQRRRKDEVALLKAQNDALVTALRATPRDATVASAQIRVLEARLETLASQVEGERAAHRSEVARHKSELQDVNQQFAAERAELTIRLQEEIATVHDLTERCDGLQALLSGPTMKNTRAADAFLGSRNAVETIDFYARRRNQKIGQNRKSCQKGPVVTPTEVEGASRRQKRLRRLSNLPPNVVSRTSLSSDASSYSSPMPDTTHVEAANFDEVKESRALAELLSANAALLQELGLDDQTMDQ